MRDVSRTLHLEKQVKRSSPCRSRALERLARLLRSSPFLTILRISQIHTEARKITGDSFGLRNAIFYNGKQLHAGHHTVVIKDIKREKCNWYRVNDDNIRVDKVTWPRNAFVAYILFLE